MVAQSSNLKISSNIIQFCPMTLWQVSLQDLPVWFEGEIFLWVAPKVEVEFFFMDGQANERLTHGATKFCHVPLWWNLSKVKLLTISKGWFNYIYMVAHFSYKPKIWTIYYMVEIISKSVGKLFSKSKVHMAYQIWCIFKIVSIFQTIYKVCIYYMQSLNVIYYKVCI